ncbi:MAG: M48 family metalloprotease, partial [Alphaproteobacteria bacterium]|nr:M48 family metalloprotease [Alphaproteobacteria bacterium]
MRRLMCALMMMWASVTAHAAAIINDTEIERHLTELVEPLATAAGIPAGRLKINVVHSDDFNAFVSGGEEVYIYTGLLTQVKTPDALQAVVAHELGHTLGGHMAQMSARMNAELKRTAIVQALGVG